MRLSQWLIAALALILCLTTTLAEAAPRKKNGIAKTQCAAMKNTNQSKCKKKIRQCWNQHRVRMKWGGRGCLRPNGKLWGDGGCMCSGSCTYQCMEKCNLDPECFWNAAGLCENKVTGKTGPLAICDGIECRQTGYFCNEPVPGAFSGDQSNCCTGHCRKVDGLFSCCNSEIGAECKANFECCAPNVCGPDGTCVEMAA